MQTTTQEISVQTTKTEPQQRMELARARLREVARALRQENPNDREGPIPDAATLLEALAGDGPELSVQIVPDFRGYARMGIGAYAVNHSAAGEPAELLISMATDAEKAGNRQVGEDRDNPDGYLIQPDDIAVRLGFENAAGLDVLEHQLRHLRAVHFPESVAAARAPAEGKVFPQPATALPSIAEMQRLRVQVRQADERGDEALRRAHAAETVLERLLNPSDLGHAVTREVRDAARVVLGLPAVESGAAAQARPAAGDSACSQQAGKAHGKSAQ